MKKDVLVLAVESSCDETSVAVVKNGTEILANIVASQIKSHQRFGGVVPEVASPHHGRLLYGERRLLSSGGADDQFDHPRGL